ncbi:hypothetical protein [Chryseobacterium sp.]|uniref:hypothetical protein n=1 Tax=Chryseobacterium sp. TaxID=1871047 RepID=UPI0028A19042|nr:hypothetical protein [Chryseobacterium sp.]
MKSLLKIAGVFLMLIFSATLSTVDAQKHHYKHKKHYYKPAKHYSHRTVVHHYRRPPVRHVVHYRKPVRHRYYRPAPVVYHRPVRHYYRHPAPKVAIIINP